jgi:hypothetical protein
MGMRNEGVTIRPAPLGKLSIGQQVVVYARHGGRGDWLECPGTITKVARVNITIEYETESRSSGAVFRKDTQSGEDNYGKMRFRTLEQAELDAKAKKGLGVLADARIRLDPTHTHLDAAQIVALAETVQSHRAFRADK